MRDEVVIARMARVEARCEPRHWRWAHENREAIAANWARRTAEKPRMFNGRVLLIGECGPNHETYRATYFEADFAEFLGWINLGYPDPTVTNGFAMGALQGSDGAFICGVMGEHTVNAGRIYFPAGTPDRSDLRPDGTVDLSASVMRELKEETGLPPDKLSVGEDWIIVRQWPAVAFLRPVTFPEPAAVIAERIRANIARQPEPELAGVRVVRGMEDVDETAMPLFLQSFFRWHFEAQR